MILSTGWPSLKTTSVGIETTPSLNAYSWLSSILTLTTLTSDSRSPAISDSTGPIALHGPHQGAQKSTTTGLSDLITSDSKVASVTSTTLATRPSLMPDDSNTSQMIA